MTFVCMGRISGQRELLILVQEAVWIPALGSKNGITRKARSSTENGDTSNAQKKELPGDDFFQKKSRKPLPLLSPFSVRSVRSVCAVGQFF